MGALLALGCFPGGDNRLGQKGARFIVVQRSRGFGDCFKAALSIERRDIVFATIDDMVTSSEALHRAWETLKRRCIVVDEVPRLAF